MAYQQGEPIVEDVDDALERARDLMARSGFVLKRDIQVAVDSKLEIMGYTLQEGRGNLIVVSEMAARSGFIEGLLVHEMSHIHRGIKHHPSHNQRIAISIIEPFRRSLKRPYQKDSIAAVFNHLEDLYADDIAFTVLLGNQTISPRALGRFLQGWVREKPVLSGNVDKDRWVNAMIMLSNAFAISNMQRHSIPDPDFKARDGSLRFLYSLRPDAAEKFGYFINIMTQMKDDISEKEFRSLAKEYLEQFIGLVNLM